MVRNEEKYDEAVRLRERGFTLAEIARYCDVSKSTVSKWLKNNAMSAVVTANNKKRAGVENAKRLRLINKARGPERAARYKEARRSAETEFRHYKDDPLFVAGVMLYTAHGDIRDESKIRFSTTDVTAHAVFVSFLQMYLGAEKQHVRCWLLLYLGQSEERCLKRYRAATGLPYRQFHKTQYVQGSNRKPLHYGVGNTIIGSTVLKHKLMKWIELLQKELVKQR